MRSRRTDCCRTALAEEQKKQAADEQAAAERERIAKETADRDLKDETDRAQALKAEIARLEKDAAQAQRECPGGGAERRWRAKGREFRREDRRADAGEGPASRVPRAGSRATPWSCRSRPSCGGSDATPALIPTGIRRR